MFCLSEFQFQESLSHRIGWWDNFNRKPLYLMVKTMVSYRFSLTPIHWHMVFLWFSHGFPMVTGFPSRSLPRKWCLWPNATNLSAPSAGPALSIKAAGKLCGLTLMIIEIHTTTNTTMSSIRDIQMANFLIVVYILHSWHWLTLLIIHRISHYIPLFLDGIEPTTYLMGCNGM